MGALRVYSRGVLSIHCFKSGAWSCLNQDMNLTARHISFLAQWGSVKQLRDKEFGDEDSINSTCLLVCFCFARR